MCVTDLTSYTYCKRKLWLARKVGIQSGRRDLDSKVRFHVLHSITSRIDSKSKIHSLTDFMLKTLNEVPGKIVDTEIYLDRDKLTGKIDVLRRTEEGYIIQEEKSSDPPSGHAVWQNDLLQVDAYAFLAEGSPQYSPVVGGVIIYNDLIPREVKPKPERAKEILGRVIELLESDVLPEAQGNINKCIRCAYYPLCQVLPQKGGLKDAEIKKFLNISRS